MNITSEYRPVIEDRLDSYFPGFSFSNKRGREAGAACTYLQTGKATVETNPAEAVMYLHDLGRAPFPVTNLKAEFLW